MKIILFTDGSADPQLRIGFGAYLALPEDQLLLTTGHHIRLKRFEDTSSAKLELQVLLWALSEISAVEVVSYTDSQNITGLNARRRELEENDYYARNGKRLKNHELYRQFYHRTDTVQITFRQIRGHVPAQGKMPVDMLFSLVDRASRKALRAYTASQNP